MGAIKDIVDLCIKLKDLNKDGKIAAALSQVQSLTLTLQSEQAALSEKNNELVTENHELKRKLRDMEDKLTAAETNHRAEIEKIKSHNSQPAPPNSNKLDDICEKMLVTLANFDGRRGITAGELVQSLGLPKAKGDYHYDQLQRRKYVAAGSMGVMGRGMFIHVTQAGRDYMAQNGLL